MAPCSKEKWSGLLHSVPQIVGPVLEQRVLGYAADPRRARRIEDRSKRDIQIRLALRASTQHVRRVQGKRDLWCRWIEVSAYLEPRPGAKALRKHWPWVVEGYPFSGRRSDIVGSVVRLGPPATTSDRVVRQRLLVSRRALAWRANGWDELRSP